MVSLTWFSAWGGITIQRLLVEKEVSCLPVVACDEDEDGEDGQGGGCVTLGRRSSSKLMPRLLGLLSPSDVLREHAYYTLPPPPGGAVE